MKDPLAGRRQDINEGRASALTWHDNGKGCPVEVGQVFVLRSCWIQITKKQRTRRNGKAVWLAWFSRTVPHRLRFLDRFGGTTEDLDRAMGAQDDLDAPTLDRISEDERSEAHRAAGEPPEPETPPYHEVPSYAFSVEAQQTYLREMTERRVEEARAPLEDRLARLRQMAGNRHVDISPEMRVIEQRIRSAERKVLERAA